MVGTIQDGSNVLSLYFALHHRYDMAGIMNAYGRAIVYIRVEADLDFNTYKEDIADRTVARIVDSVELLARKGTVKITSVSVQTPQDLRAWEVEIGCHNEHCGGCYPTKGL